MTSLSVLDLAPITADGDAASSFANSLDLARHAEALGYRRYWVAEHHNMPGIASAATAVVIGHLAAGTRTIRVGAGGIMLPNHAPLVIAEQFGTLASLHPGRIDLGIGRAPGTDQRTAYALRRTLNATIDDFPRDVLELQAYLAEPQPDQRVRAFPGAGTRVPLFILGSSLYGASLAAALGLPYAFASHFAPDALMDALAVYRSQFQPSDTLDAPYAMAGFNVFAAETEDAARLMRTSSRKSMLHSRRGTPIPLPPPDPGFEASLEPHERAMLDAIGACSAVGTVDMVGEQMAEFVGRTGVDELIVTGHIHDHGRRLRSYELAMEAWTALAA